MFPKKKWIKKIKKYNFDDYDSDIYKEYIKDLSNFIEETVKSDEEFDEDIEVVIEILDLFQKEANHWQVKDGKIYTDNEELGAKFKWLANKICDNCFEEETISQM